MRFTGTDLDGLMIVEADRREDERGSFARTFCADEFSAAGLPTRFVQCNLSFNRQRGTLRGMHFQGAPFPEGKLVRCIRGSVFDVAIDLRPASPTRNRWVGVELTAANGRALFVPEGFAHGFVTLEDDTELFYQMTEFYHPELAGGVRWDDPAFAIAWPVRIPILSPRDAALNLLADAP
jgi:dTDP-4-dehydrorhamnose 3,5-epimerase